MKMFDNETSNDIVYLDYKTSAVANWGINNSSRSDSIISIIKDSNVVYADQIILTNNYHKDEKRMWL